MGNVEVVLSYKLTTTNENAFKGSFVKLRVIFNAVNGAKINLITSGIHKPA